LSGRRKRKDNIIDTRGVFVTLEGIEGSGKTTLMPAAVDCLKSLGRDCVVTREPGGTAIGRAVREILLSSANRSMDPMAELLLYMADRAQHLAEIVRPALAQGKAVICDRYYDATVAYQGYARGLDVDRIDLLHTVAIGGLTPDLTLLFDLAPDLGLTRAWRRIEAGGRSAKETRFEEEALEFHRRVRAGYLELARQAPDRFRVVDAARSIEAVRDDLDRVLRDAFG